MNQDEIDVNRLHNLMQHTIRHGLTKKELAAWASEFTLCSVTAARKMELGELRTLIIDECRRRIDEIESKADVPISGPPPLNVIRDRLVEYQKELVERADSLDKFSVTIMPGGDLSGHAAEVRRIADELKGILEDRAWVSELHIPAKITEDGAP